MTTASPASPRFVPRFAWGWLVVSLVAAASAVVLTVVTTSTRCSGGTCEAIVAGGPIGWFAVGVLVLQAVWALVRTFVRAPE